MANAQPTNATPAWRVISQTTTTAAGDDGKFTTGWNVTIETRGGHRPVVFIPDSRYRADYVSQRLSEAAAMADAIGSLQG